MEINTNRETANKLKKNSHSQKKVLSFLTKNTYNNRYSKRNDLSNQNLVEESFFHDK